MFIIVLVDPVLNQYFRFSYAWAVFQLFWFWLTSTTIRYDRRV